MRRLVAIKTTESLLYCMKLRQEEGPFVRSTEGFVDHGREKVSLLLERESRQDRRTIESTLPGVGYGPQVRSMQGQRIC